MDTLENQTPASDVTALKEQYEDLRHLVVSGLVLLLIVSGTLLVFMLRQYRFTKSDLDVVRPQVTAMQGEANKLGNSLQEFVRKLDDFSKGHPDFAPIAAKYRLHDLLTKSASPVSPAPATSPVPPAAPPAAAPK